VSLRTQQQEGAIWCSPSSLFRRALWGILGALMFGGLWLMLPAPLVPHVVRSLPTIIAESVACDFGGPARQVQLTGINELPWGHQVVRFTLLCHDSQGGQPYWRMGHITVQRSLLSWRPLGNGVTREPDPPAPEDLFQMYLAIGRNPDHRYLIVYGDTLDRRVGALEVRFADGQSIPTQVVDGRFELVRLTDSLPCSARLLDEQHGLLQERTLGICD
jgi:hypothetical protein